MDYINKFKINGVVVDCEELPLKSNNGNSFTVKKIKVEQEKNNGRYTRRDVFEIQMDFKKEGIMKGDTVEITGFVKSNPSKDNTRWFIVLVGTECNVINRPKKSEYKAYRNTEQPEPNPCLSEGEDFQF